MSSYNISTSIISRKHISYSQITPKVDFSENQYYESTFDFYDENLLEEVKNKNANVHRFFTILCLCHTVMPEVKDGMYSLKHSQNHNINNISYMQWHQ